MPHQLAHTSGQNTGALPHNTQEKADVHDGATALSHAEGPEARKLFQESMRKPEKELTTKAMEIRPSPAVGLLSEREF